MCLILTLFYYFALLYAVQLNSKEVLSKFTDAGVVTYILSPERVLALKTIPLWH